MTAALAAAERERGERSPLLEEERVSHVAILWKKSTTTRPEDDREGNRRVQKSTAPIGMLSEAVLTITKWEIRPNQQAQLST